MGDDQRFQPVPWAVEQAAREAHSPLMIELAGSDLPDAPAAWRGYRQTLATDAGAELPETLRAAR